jgi:hypothetical protein
LKEAVEWLTRGDVRLSMPVKRDDIEGYGLAHERLIPALRRIANKELTEADRANLLPADERTTGRRFDQGRAREPEQQLF